MILQSSILTTIKQKQNQTKPITLIHKNNVTVNNISKGEYFSEEIYEGDYERNTHIWCHSKGCHFLNVCSAFVSEFYFLIFCFPPCRTLSILRLNNGFIENYKYTWYH